MTKRNLNAFDFDGFFLFNGEIIRSHSINNNKRKDRAEIEEKLNKCLLFMECLDQIVK